ncbi:MAG: SDR family NAD(P)-dependent oxidoreductase [Actinomycetota bacterium]|nr:MAG: SDR family NAD(P)-dependent oxidoreductase [Actinomycetota bacterium]
MDISKLSAFVTGGASGLGAATAKRLSELGAAVTIFDRDEERAKATAEELGNSVAWAAGDVTSESDVMQALERSMVRLPLRVVVNCAGIGHIERVVNREGMPHDLVAFEKVIRVNLVGTFNVLRLASSLMASNEPVDDNERGVIVNTASVAAFDGQIGQVAYSASKGGLVGLTLPAARDLSSAGIRVMTIAPGIVDTPLLGQLPDEVRSALAASVPFPKRLGVPQDYALLVEMIVKSGYLNGEVIRLDGALRMAPK